MSKSLSLAVLGLTVLSLTARAETELCTFGEPNLNTWINTRPTATTLMCSSDLLGTMEMPKSWPVQSPDSWRHPEFRRMDEEREAKRLANAPKSPAFDEMAAKIEAKAVNQRVIAALTNDGYHSTGEVHVKKLDVYKANPNDGLLEAMKARGCHPQADRAFTLCVTVTEDAPTFKLSPPPLVQVPKPVKPRKKAPKTYESNGSSPPQGAAARAIR